MAAGQRRCRGWRVVAEQRGNVYVEYLILIAVLGLGGFALVSPFASSADDSAGATGDALVAMQSRDAQDSQAAAYAPASASAQPLNLQLVSAKTGGGGFGNWLSSFAGGLWDRKGEILLSGLALTGGLLIADAGVAIATGGGLVVLSGVGAPVGGPVAVAGGAVAVFGALLASAGGYGLISNIWQAASDASSEQPASSSGASSLSDQELQDLSKNGDVEATVELNRRKAAAARAAGDDNGARGYDAENEVIAALGDQVEEAGRVVSYPTERGQVKTDIDVETTTEVIQVKSGSDLPKPNQAEATRRRAAETGKTPKVIYDPARVPPNAVRDFQQRNPDFVLEPRSFGS